MEPELLCIVKREKAYLAHSWLCQAACYTIISRPLGAPLYLTATHRRRGVGRAVISFVRLSSWVRLRAFSVARG